MKNPRLCVSAALVVFVACGPVQSGPTGGAAWIGPGPGDPVNIAHRGASGHAPENTLAAFDLALQMGAHYVELDVQRTLDGVPIVLHDVTLDRTARGPAQDCTGRVAEKTLAQIRACDAGSWFNEQFPERARAEFVGLRIPTLEEVFRRFGNRAGYLVELKSPEEYPGLEDDVAEQLEQHRLRPPSIGPRQVIVQSFSDRSVRRLHAIDPELALVQLTGGGATRDSLRGIMGKVGEYATGVGPAKGTVDRALVRAAHAAGLVVYPYTVDDTVEMQALLEMGVDGIITNFPDRLAALDGR